MQSKAATVAEYLASLPSDRREALTFVRSAILANLDQNYEERMSYGMIGWAVPHRLFPAGYHCDPKMPLPFGGLASQKNYMSLYLMGIYDEGPDALSNWFREAWGKSGKKLDMGKCCIRFKKVEDLALDVISEAIRRMPVKKYIECYQKALASQTKQTKGKPKAATKRVAAKAAKRAAEPAPKPARRTK